MNSNQQVLFLGRLRKNPELRYTRKQEPVCRLSVAVPMEGSDKPYWHKVVVWGKQAELCQVFLGKGTQVFVQAGNIQRTTAWFWRNKNIRRNYCGQGRLHKSMTRCA